MKFSSLLLSLTTFGAASVMAFPVANGARDLQPVRRSEAPTATATPSATATSTESSVSSVTETATSSSAEPTETGTYLYSTITDSDASAPQPTTRTTTSSSSTSTTTETQMPQETDSVSSSGSSRNVDLSRAVVVRVRETVVIREQIIVERPILVAVQLNVRVQQTIIVNHITNVFQSRFDNWDINVVNQLALIIAQQFGVLSRAGNRGFDRIDSRQFNAFVERFVQQFQVFQQIRLVDVQKFIVVVQRFDINQLASFFGRSQLLFSQNTFDRFNVNNDFGVFVQQLSNMLFLIQSGAFDSDGIFSLDGVTLIDGGLNLGRSSLQV